MMAGINSTKQRTILIAISTPSPFLIYTAIGGKKMHKIINNTLFIVKLRIYLVMAFSTLVLISATTRRF